MINKILKNSNSQRNNIESERILRGYSLKALRYEKKLWQRMQMVRDTPIRRYFNSTPVRNAFLRWMVSARYEKLLVTISQTAKEMGISRQAVRTMVQETSLHGWVNKKKEGKINYIEASATLALAWEQYIEWLLSCTETTILRDQNAVYALRSLQQDLTS